MGGERSKYVTVSLPIGIAKAIDSLIEELGYWPSRGAFAREACLEKIREERRMLREFREATEAAQSTRGSKPRRGTNPGISPRESGGVTNPQGNDSSPKRKGG
ncbi:MAG: hypothetical protein HWN66_20725 [Candidatus Helarchaeota archaeon]|nr:hypothetical protein [Candidatus Helarchaeota archaeon]